MIKHVLFSLIFTDQIDPIRVIFHEQLNILTSTWSRIEICQFGENNLCSILPKHWFQAFYDSQRAIGNLKVKFTAIYQYIKYPYLSVVSVSGCFFFMPVHTSESFGTNDFPQQSCKASICFWHWDIWKLFSEERKVIT